MVQREHFIKPDGATWTSYPLEGGELLLTAQGNQLLHDSPEVIRLFRAYRKAVTNRTPGRARIPEVDGMPARQHFTSGGNSDLYTFGSRLVVKEGTGAMSLYSALERMDELHNVLEKGSVPRWIDMPTHYGLLVARSLDRQYLLMEKVDAGITVEHVVKGGGTTAAQREELATKFGDMGSRRRWEVAGQFSLMREHLNEAISRQGLNPDQYLPDWHEGNVLVEPLKVPIGDSHYKFWIIDQ